MLVSKFNLCNIGVYEILYVVVSVLSNFGGKAKPVGFVTYTSLVLKSCFKERLSGFITFYIRRELLSELGNSVYEVFFCAKARRFCAACCASFC